MSIAGTVLAARRLGLLRLRPADRPVRLVCLQDACSKCCSIPGIAPVLLPGELKYIPPHLVSDTSEGMAIVGCASGCTALSNGLCSIHANRPQGCREYPFYNVDGQLYVDSGCPGLNFDKDGRPPVDEITPYETYFPAPYWLQRLLLRVFCWW